MKQNDRRKNNKRAEELPEMVRAQHQNEGVTGGAVASGQEHGDGQETPSLTLHAESTSTFTRSSSWS